MKTIDYWGEIIPARWFNLRAGFAACLLLPAFAFLAPAAELAESKLGQGINAYNVHDYSTAIQQLRGLQIPKLNDYIAYYLASSELQTSDFDGAVRDLTAYRKNPSASSPLAGKISLAMAHALLDRHVAASNTEALQVLQTDYKLLPQPDGDFTLAMAYEAQGEKLQAALTYVKVYYGSPNTDLAAHSWDAMVRLKADLGKDFPSAPAVQQLDRCQRWLDAKQYANAKQEYAALAESLPEPDRDDARVGVGAAEVLAGETTVPLHYLKDLKPAKSQADAARLYYIEEIARKMGDDAEMMNAVKQLDERYPQSTWRLKALIAAGNRFAATNDKEKYQPLFKAASDSFSADPTTASSHWKITWDAYLADKPERADLLRQQIERYPADSKSSTALYFLGRIQEKQNKPAEARAYYDRLTAQFPHYFYATLARERLADDKVAAATPDETVSAWLNGIAWPEHRDFTATEPNPATRLRIDRARLLMAAGLPDVADAELRFGAKTETEQPHLLALELARSMPSPFYSLRIMKSFIADYLAIPFEGAPLRFWQMLFPLPYRDDVVRNAKSHDLDPYSVAALIRQETEFNPDAHSPANAYGLMQLVLPTGRQMGRQTGITVASSRTLLNPSVSIQLGTQYLRGQLDNWNGDWAETLAAYNAGPSRVRQWLSLGTFREPAEFVESIPFTETREYVQAVLRNAEMYRTIYGEKHPGAADVKDLSEVAPVNLSILPAAARTPGGGARTTTATRAAAAPSKTSVASKKAPARTTVSAKRPAAKKTEATKKPAPKKKKTDPA
jgi:soluble lytic murein transglycosylase